ncbi:MULTISPECIES: hypothetical protein [Prochlorococcus]|nr:MULTISPECIES: hypothetical protein [Prochlorococcus]
MQDSLSEPVKRSIPSMSYKPYKANSPELLSVLEGHPTTDLNIKRI